MSLQLPPPEPERDMRRLAVVSCSAWALNGLVGAALTGNLGFTTSGLPDDARVVGIAKGREEPPTWDVIVQSETFPVVWPGLGTVPPIEVQCHALPPRDFDPSDN